MMRMARKLNNHNIANHFSKTKYIQMNTKIIFLLLVISSFTLPAMAQYGFTNKAEAKNVLKDGVKEGKWMEYSNGDSIINIKDSADAVSYILVVYQGGKPVGIVREYYISGPLLSETPFSGGKENGVKKAYYPGGKLMGEMPYKDGILNGVEKNYYSEGKLISEIPFTNGKVNGVLKKYYESGAKDWEIPFKDGKKNGVAKEYYENGKLKSETPFADDKVNGDVKSY